MFLNLTLQADLQALQQWRQLLVDKNLMNNNSKQQNNGLQPQQQVLVKIVSPTMLGKKSEGPYRIE